MRRVALIYNPASGQHSARRRSAIDRVIAVLHAAKIEVEAIETLAPGSAGAQAADAVRRGCDTILACGGDGTVHEVLQSLVGTETVLGVVPLGTANALAANLGLGANPAKAVRKLLNAEPTRFSVGRISYVDASRVTRSRYFTVAAGVGADALFLSRLDPGLKRRLGYILYVIEAFRLWATHSFPLFEAAFAESGHAEPRVEALSQLLAVRIRDFGGALNHFVPGASLHRDNLRLVAFKTRSRFRYFCFMMAAVIGRHAFTDDIELLDAVSVECRPCSGTLARVFAEADGELLGDLPVRIEIVPQAITLLIPTGAKP
ncbi:MAG: diacylglycerol kinase family protein [Terracidiphilus sp.]|jgi:YegS/Rv2252/BmrU family lipid kinase